MEKAVKKSGKVWTGLFRRKPGEPQSFKNCKKIVNSTGYVSLEDRLTRLQLAGLRTVVAKDKYGRMLPIADEFYDKDFTPVLMNRHETPDLADIYEAWLVMRERRERIHERVVAEAAKKKAGAKPQEAKPPEVPPLNGGRGGAGGGESAPASRAERGE